MEDKTFELLTKMYSEFSKFRKETKEDISKLKDSMILIESKMDGLYDGYQQTYEKTLDIEAKLDNLSAKVEMHDLEIKALRRAVLI